MFLWLRRLLFRPVLWASRKFSSSPARDRVFKSLTELYKCILKGEKKKGPLVGFNCTTDRILIFSDQHKGAHNGADDFMLCEPNYLAALDYYFQKNYFFISLGDCEELWENSLADVKKAQQKSFEKEKQFVTAERFIKVIGNHDLYWANDPFAYLQLKEIYGCTVPVYEGVVLQTKVNDRPLDIFCTHGHQGDLVSDGNWFSKFFISRIWAPLQSLLRINPNTPAYDAQLKTVHNSMMYDWSAAQKDVILITGHTHQPVFESLTHIERLYRQFLYAQNAKDKDKMEVLQKEITKLKFEYNSISPDYLKLKPGYFNSGCCCYSDGDITGIEIEKDCIRLIKWHVINGLPGRIVLEEAELKELF
jgi:UDP-2,3-diacylglucosamine pyrophosphatase LpxH